MEVFAIATRCYPDGPRIEFRCFSLSVQTYPEAYPVYYTMGIYSLPGMATARYPHLASRLKKGYSYNSTPPLGLYRRLHGKILRYGTVITLMELCP
jgi:hypothetical protein